MGAWHRVVPALAVIASLLAFGMVSQAHAGEAKRRRRARPEKVSGVVKEVQAEARQLVVDVKGESKTYTLGARATITMRGPILDGVKPGDKADLEVVKGAKGNEVVKKLTISRGDTAEKPPKARGRRGSRKGGRRGKKPSEPKPDEDALPGDEQGGGGLELE
jgi:hypothetical protein